MQPRRTDSAYWGRRNWVNGRTAQGRIRSGRPGRRGPRVGHRTAGVGTRLWTEFASVTLLRCLAGLPSGLILAPTGRYIELTYEPEKTLSAASILTAPDDGSQDCGRRVRRHPQPDSFARAARDRAAWRLARATLAARVLRRESGSEPHGLDQRHKRAAPARVKLRRRQLAPSGVRTTWESTREVNTTGRRPSTAVPPVRYGERHLPCAGASAPTRSITE